MGRRGFLAEMQHQKQVAAREAERRQRAAIREHEAAVRRNEQARKAEERAQASADRASDAERKRLEKEAKAAHLAAMQAEVEERNAALAAQYDEVDGLLQWTLGVDDHVDLETLRRTVEHPPFDRTDLERPVPPPPTIPDPAEPVLAPVEPPKTLFGRKKKLAEAESAAQEEFAAAHAAWKQELEALPARRAAAAEEHAAKVTQRQQELEAERERYEQECAEREAEVAEHNAAIDSLIANLGYGTADAVQEYVGIVLSNSVYPEHFEVEHVATFEPSTAELQVRALIPGPEAVPAIKAYKYAKGNDEITTTALSQKACKDRYASAVDQVALRTLHEIFEADRRGLIKTISLEVGTETTDPATGNHTYIPFAAVAAERETFLSFDLTGVVPSATLEHLGASVSKNPLGLVAADTSGIRRS
jgi:restriction system protein